MEAQENNEALTGEEALTLAERMERKSHGEIGMLAGGFLDRIGYTAAVRAIAEDETGECAQVPLAELMAGYVPMALAEDGEEPASGGTVMVEISEEELAAIREAADRCTALEGELSILNSYGVGMSYKKWEQMSDSEVARIAASPGFLKGTALGRGTDFPMYAGAAQGEAAKRLERLALEKRMGEVREQELERYLREHRDDLPAPKPPFRPA